MLTQEQMDIINLAGQAKDTPFATYKLELDSNENVKESKEQQQKIPEFFNPTYNHPAQFKYQAPTKPVQATDPQTVAPKQSEQEKHEVIHFSPEEQDEENYQYQHENLKYYSESSLAILRDLNQEHYSVVSDPSFMPHDLVKMNKELHASAASVDRAHLVQSMLSCQSTNSAHHKSLVRPIQMKILAGYP